MAVRHPYHFAGFRNILNRECPQRFPPGGRSGIFSCRLTTLTPLCLKAHFASLRAKGEAPFLTGSSLKGTVRSFLQLLGAGCGMQYEYIPRKDQPEVTPPELGGLSACASGEACPVCRLFGYVYGNSAWAAKVRFHDSERAAEWNPSRWMAMDNGKARMESQGPYRAGFYGPPDQPAGWKYYLHSKSLTGVDFRFHSPDCVPAGVSFEFRVDYQGLTPEEYTLLRFGLSLLDVSRKIQWHHKVGYGKPLGYGSCKVEIESQGREVHNATAEDDGAILEKYLGDARYVGRLAKYLDFLRAADALQYPGGAWLQDNPKGSIADYETWLASNATSVPPKQSPRITDVPSGRVTLRVTSCRNNVVKAETVDGFGERQARYRATWTAKSMFDRKNAGDLVEAEVVGVDSKEFTLQVRVSS